MSVSYDVFTDAFLNKITEYEFLAIEEITRNEVIDGYMKRAISAFRKICKYDFLDSMNDATRSFDVDIPDEDLDEILDIVSEGMLGQWMKPYMFRQENFENILNTRDFASISPAQMLLRIGEAYKSVKKDFISMMRDYSYNHGDLTDLHI